MIIVLLFVLYFYLKDYWVKRYTIKKKMNHTIEKYKKQKLSILTYNIKRLPFSMKPLFSLSKLFRSYSFILLQECFINVFLEDIDDSHFPDFYIIKSSKQISTLINSGIIILSKFPVLSYQFVPFDCTDIMSSEIFTEKGFLDILVEVDDKKIHIINTHLQSSTQKENKFAFLQYKQLYSYVKNLKSDWIIGGDFNVHHDIIPSYFKPYMYIPDDPTIYIHYKGTTEQDTSCTPKEHYEPFIFDYFLSSLYMKPVTLSHDYSDHLPVSSEIYFHRI